MNAGMIRLGGVLVFVSLALGLAAVIAIIATRGQLNSSITITLQVGGTALWTYVLFATKALFNHQNYRSANFPIMAIIVLGLVNLGLSLAQGTSFGHAMTPDTAIFSTLSLSSMGVSLVTLVLAFWFAIAMIRFGNRVDSGLWKAVGILYLVAFAVFAVAVVTGLVGIGAAIDGFGNGTFGENPESWSGLMKGTLLAAGLAALVGSGAVLASWICQGVGLITGPSRIATGEARS